MTYAHLGPLSPAQDWMLELNRQWEPDHSAIVMGRTFELEPDVNESALADALADCSIVHGALRTIFPGGSKQAVTEEVPTIRVVRSPDGGLDGLILRELERPIDLENGPTARVALIRTTSETALLFVVHHATFDGGSWSLLLSDWSAAYAARLRPGRLLRKVVARPSQLDYARESRAPALAHRRAANESYWRGRFTLDAASSASREVGVRPRLAARAFRLPKPGMGMRLRALARSQRLTLFMALLAAESILAAAWSGSDDVVVHTPRNDRLDRRFEDTAGCLIGLLLLRFTLGGATTIASLLQSAGTEMLQAAQHQDVEPRLLADVTPRAFEFYAREGSSPLPSFAGKLRTERRIDRVKVGSPAMRLVNFQPVVFVNILASDIDIRVELDVARHGEEAFGRVAEMYGAALTSILGEPSMPVRKAIRSVLDAGESAGSPRPQ